LADNSPLDLWLAVHDETERLIDVCTTGVRQPNGKSAIDDSKIKEAVAVRRCYYDCIRTCLQDAWNEYLRA
jgi:hypothetical protein